LQIFICDHLLSDRMEFVENYHFREKRGVCMTKLSAEQLFQIGMRKLYKQQEELIKDPIIAANFDAVRDTILLTAVAEMIEAYDQSIQERLKSLSGNQDHE